MASAPPPDPQVKAEDEQRVQHGVEDRAGQGTEHGIGGAAVGADQIAASGGKGEQRQAEGGDAGIGEGVGKHIRRSAEGQQQGTAEQEGDRAQTDAQESQNHQARARHLAGAVLMTGAEIQIEIGRGTNAHEQGDRSGDVVEGKGHIGGGIAQKADPLPDKDLIYNVIQGGDQKGDDRGDGEFGQELSDGSGAKGIGGRLEGFRLHAFLLAFGPMVV